MREHHWAWPNPNKQKMKERVKRSVQEKWNKPWSRTQDTRPEVTEIVSHFEMSTQWCSEVTPSSVLRVPKFSVQVIPCCVLRRPKIPVFQTCTKPIEFFLWPMAGILTPCSQPCNLGSLHHIKCESLVVHSGTNILSDVELGHK